MFKEINTIKPFFESPNKEFGVREISRIIKVSPATASNELKELSKKGVLIIKEERGFSLYRANLESDLYKDIKVFYNLRKIKDSGILNEINNFYLKPTIILFGSFSNGLDNEKSDIDLTIISEKTKEFPKLKEFETKLKRELHFFIVKDLKDLKNTNLINNVLNGIVIQGEIKWT